MYKQVFKPFLDFIIALAVFALLLPVFIIITTVLYIANDGKPFFYQIRPGKNEKLFTIIKFKTMNDKKDASGNLLPDVERLTLMGNFIRKTSLDEIPQLLNVIKGDMSLIGPRPLLPEYLPFYNTNHRRRHEVKPGITGLAQIAGRNSIKFSKRFALDVEYVNKVSFLLDCKIIWHTITRLFKSEEIRTGQTVDEVDDVGVSKNLPAYHFRRIENADQ